MFLVRAAGRGLGGRSWAVGRAESSRQKATPKTQAEKLQEPHAYTLDLELKLRKQPQLEPGTVEWWWWWQGSRQAQTGNLQMAVPPPRGPFRTRHGSGSSSLVAYQAFPLWLHRVSSRLSSALLPADLVR